MSTTKIHPKSQARTGAAHIVPSGYKRTEVGVIPEDWDVDRIDRHACINTGAKNTQDRTDDGEYPFFVRSQEVERINSYSYDGEAVLTAGDGVGTGKVFHYINGRFDVHQRVYRISDFSSWLDGRYFYYQFSMRFYDRIMSMTAKSSVDSVRMEMIAGMHVPLPSPAEQRAIAGALSDVDGLIGALDKLVAKKRAIKKAAMQQLLTGKTRLPGFEHHAGYEQTDVGVIPEDWDVDRIDSHACIKTGAKNTQDRTDDGEYPFFVRSQEVERINSYSYEGEAVLTAGDGVGTGKVFHYINGRFDVHQRVYRITDFSSRLNGRYFYYQFSTRFYDRIMAMTAKSSVDSVRMEMIAGMQIPLPSSAEQCTIVAVLSDMDAEITALELRRDKTMQIKQGMMQSLLTGRVRLVNPPEAEARA